jgi:hypothetical protein
MMIRTGILVFLLVILSNDGYSQEKQSAGKWRFVSINQAGLLQGENGSAFLLQTINGFEKKHFFAGIGTGLDFYRFTSIPLFADVRKYFGNKRQFFIYADGGFNFTWEKKDGNPNYTSKWKAGFYGDGGIGCLIRAANGTGILISTGYSYKRVTDIQQQNYCPSSSGPCNIVDNYIYDFNRLAIKIGVEL